MFIKVYFFALFELAMFEKLRLNKWFIAIRKYAPLTSTVKLLIAIIYFTNRLFVTH